MANEAIGNDISRLLRTRLSWSLDRSSRLHLDVAAGSKSPRRQFAERRTLARAVRERKQASDSTNYPKCRIAALNGSKCFSIAAAIAISTPLTLRRPLAVVVEERRSGTARP